MEKKRFYLLLDELLENDPGTISGGEQLQAFARWDSLAVIGFIALIDQHFNMSVPASQILDCKSVADLAGLVGDRLTD
jgi:acyl carrier protein